MIDLLYHATINYKIRKFVQESEPATLTYEMVIEKAKAHECNVLEYKDHQASHRGANSAPSYNNPLLSAHDCLKDGPVATVIMANIVVNVANLMSEATAPHMGKLATSARVLIISKPFVIPRLQQRRRRAIIEARSHSHTDSSMGSYSGQGKGGSNRQPQKKKTPKKLPKQKAYAVTFKNSVPSEVTTTSGGERERIMVKYHQRWSFQDRRKACTTGFLALQFKVKCLKAPTLRVSL